MEGSSFTVTDTDNEFGKRIGRKERVRRRYISKRIKKDDPEDYYAMSLNAQPRLYSSVTVSQAQLYHADNEVDPQLLCIPVNGGNALSGMTRGAEVMRDYYPTALVHDSEY